MQRSICIIFFFCPLLLFSQSFSPTVISTAGNQGSSANYQLSYTIGQLNTYSGGNQSIVFSQGFQQSFSSAMSIEQPMICLVTLDSLTQKNKVVWERQAGHGTDYYNIYRETTTAGIYAKIGIRPFDSLSVFVDKKSDPRKQAYRYRISAVDSTGKESSLSAVHKTIHLIVYKGLSNENQLLWSGYEGKPFGTYYIYRGKKIKNLKLIDSIKSNLFSYSDFTATSGVQYYLVTFKFKDACQPSKFRSGSDSYDQSISNIRDYSSLPAEYLSVAPPIQTLNNAIDTAIFEVFTNLDSFTAIPDQSWLTAKVDTASNRVIAYPQPNTTMNMRSASIKVSGFNVADQYVTVFQNGGYTSIQNKTALTDVSVYPNPYQGFTNIAFTLDNKVKLAVNVYTITGKLIKNFYSGEANSGKYHFKFSANELGFETGLYLMIIQIDDKQIVRKLIELK